MKYIKYLIFFVLITCFSFSITVLRKISKFDVYTSNNLRTDLEIAVIVGFSVAILMPLISNYSNNKAKKKEQ